jgi:hypothetical protein
VDGLYNEARHTGFAGNVLWELGMHGQFIPETRNRLATAFATRAEGRARTRSQIKQSRDTKAIESTGLVWPVRHAQFVTGAVHPTRDRLGLVMPTEAINLLRSFQDRLGRLGLQMVPFGGLRGSRGCKWFHLAGRPAAGCASWVILERSRSTADRNYLPNRARIPQLRQLQAAVPLAYGGITCDHEHTRISAQAQGSDDLGGEMAPA